MTATYKGVGWNRQKKLYDLGVASGVALYLVTFIAAGLMLRPEITAETLLIRALGTAALLLLHVVLSIGPLSRLDARFLPLLYNRRHLGVTMFLLALAHGVFSTIQFHALGDLNPFVSLLSANSRLDSLHQFPFQPLGLAALGILFLMAATSHDFWLSQFTAPTWKRLHMAVYLAYGLIVGHVALGALQSERHWGLAAMLALGAAWLVAIHTSAGWRERKHDHDVSPTSNTETDAFVAVCAVGEVAPGRGKIVSVAGERVAIFRDGDRMAALSNVCQHQNGPLGEGRIVKGCVVCPWHGYEYDLETGGSPPPFTERVPTFDVRIVDGQVWIGVQPNRAGTPGETAIIEAPHA